MLEVLLRQWIFLSVIAQDLYCTVSVTSIGAHIVGHAQVQILYFYQSH